MVHWIINNAFSGYVLCSHRLHIECKDTSSAFYAIYKLDFSGFYTFFHSLKKDFHQPFFDWYDLWRDKKTKKKPDVVTENTLGIIHMLR